MAGLFEMKAAINISQRPAPLEKVGKVPEPNVSEYVSGMSHELRTPLNVIIGLCQFLERDRETPLQPIQHDAVRRMERNARSLLYSVNHLLEYLRDDRLGRRTPD
jgi:two-component system, sensor histidine kinase and response regulator